MTQEQPITPPPELVEQWYRDWRQLNREKLTDFPEYIATQAARWGYEQRGAVNEAELQQAMDEELEACINWIIHQPWTWTSSQLRAARRPRPPSLKEQALKVLFEADEADGADHPIPILVLSSKDAAVIRRALEALPDD